MKAEDTIKREFMHSKITETREAILSAHRELMGSLDKPQRRKSLERFIEQQLTKLELYQDGKLDIDAEVRLRLLLSE